MVVCFNMLILGQQDLEKAVTFYERLGFIKQLYVPNEWAEMDLKGFKLALYPSEQNTVQTGIVLEVSDIVAMHAWCKDQGVEVGPIIEKIHGKMMSINDPSYNSLDLYQPAYYRYDQFVGRVKKTESGCGGKTICCQER